MGYHQVLEETQRPDLYGYNIYGIYDPLHGTPVYILLPSGLTGYSIF